MDALLGLLTGVRAACCSSGLDRIESQGVSTEPPTASTATAKEPLPNGKLASPVPARVKEGEAPVQAPADEAAGGASVHLNSHQQPAAMQVSDARTYTNEVEPDSPDAYPDVGDLWKRQGQGSRLPEAITETTNTNISMKSATSRISLSDDPEHRKAKQEIREFVKEMTRGREMNVLAKSGGVRSCKLLLTRKLDFFEIQIGANSRKFAPTEISHIHGGDEAAAELELPLDVFCATLELESGDCVTFRFDNVPSRESFVLRLRMFVDSRIGKAH